MRCVFMETAFTVLFIAGLCNGNTYLVREHFYVPSLKSWYHAKAFCRDYYTDLSSILTEDDVERVLNAVPGRDPTSSWIGLVHNTKNNQLRWRWSVGSNVDFEKWGVGQPVSHDTHDCGYMSNGLWYNKRCGERRAFFCFKTYNRMLTVVQEMLPWESALDYCRSKYTDLSSLLSMNTAEQLINNSTGVTTDFVWTSLRFLMGRWNCVNEISPRRMANMFWSDTSHLACPAIPLRCGALSFTRGFFEARSCEEKLNFICY